MNRSHKFLRFVDNYLTSEPERLFEYEIYECSSNSWRVLEVTPDFEIEDYHRGVSVKGNTYFFAHEKICDIECEDEEGTISEVGDFLICFHFTSERFGPHRLPLPFHSYVDECVTLSCVRDEQLAVLYYKEGINHNSSGKLESWVTSTIEPNTVSWSKFLKVEMEPFALTGVKFHEHDGGSFFIDEEEKVAVVFDLNDYVQPIKNPRHHTAFVFGEDGYFKPVSLGEAPNLGERCPLTGYTPEIYCPALVCSSSYRPSLVQVNQAPRKRKERDV